METLPKVIWKDLKSFHGLNTEKEAIKLAKSESKKVTKERGNNDITYIVYYVDKNNTGSYKKSCDPDYFEWVATYCLRVQLESHYQGYKSY